MSATEPIPILAPVLVAGLRMATDTQLPHPEVPIVLDATAGPITVYYCKAGLKNGRTCRVSQSLNAESLKKLQDLQGYTRPVGTWDCKGVKFHGVSGEMIHDNATGKAKRSGARCVLNVEAGQVEMIDEVRR